MEHRGLNVRSVGSKSRRLNREVIKTKREIDRNRNRKRKKDQEIEESIDIETDIVELFNKR